MDMTCRATKRLSCFFIKNNLKNLFKNQFSLLTFWRIYDIIKTQKRRTKHTCWCGGILADTRDLKSLGGNAIRVQVPSPAPSKFRCETN